jgi:hypothetical protein
MSSCKIISTSNLLQKKRKKRNYLTKAFCTILAWKIANLLEICNTTGIRNIPNKPPTIIIAIVPPLDILAISQSKATSDIP